jgi:hypothetical protein
MHLLTTKRFINNPKTNNKIILVIITIVLLILINYNTWNIRKKLNVGTIIIENENKIKLLTATTNIPNNLVVTDLQQELMESTTSNQFTNTDSFIDEPYNNSLFNTNNPHTNLQSIFHSLATSTAVPMLNVTIIGKPHFYGGKNVIQADLLQRGFKLMEHLPGRNDPHYMRPQWIIVSCRDLGTSMDDETWFNKPNRIISASIRERANVLKRPFYWAIKAAAKKYGCPTSYTHIIPETYMLEFQPECQLFLQLLHNNTQYINSTWFLKTRLESFGRGVQIITSNEIISTSLVTLKDCNNNRIEHKIDFLAQRSLVNQALRINGKVIQSRSYLIIARYFPLLVFFMDGYVNVAPSESLSITNAHGNSSPRLMPFELYQYLQLHHEFSQQDILKLRTRMKFTIFRALWAVKDRLNLKRSVGSYSIFGVDIIFHSMKTIINTAAPLPNSKMLKIAILELNCNAELFNRVDIFGLTRVRTTHDLIHNVHDLILSITYHSQEVTMAILRNMDKVKDPLFSLQNEEQFATNTTYKRALELLYSENLPKFNIIRDSLVGGGSSTSNTGDDDTVDSRDNEDNNNGGFCLLDHDNKMSD